jgi:type VI secretion system secreted protein Hcp
MSMPGFLTINGETQGNIEGSCEKTGFENTIEILTFEHEISIPRNRESGLYLGKRIHYPIGITKEVDKSTPKLYQALCKGEKLVEAVFTWVRFMKANRPEKFFIIRITNAAIIEIKPYIDDYTQATVESKPHLEKVAFTYEAINWTWAPDGGEFEDFWTAGDQ